MSLEQPKQPSNERAVKAVCAIMCQEVIKSSYLDNCRCGELTADCAYPNCDTGEKDKQDLKPYMRDGCKEPACMDDQGKCFYREQYEDC